MASKGKRLESQCKIDETTVDFDKFTDRPALTVEARQNQLISLATDCAEKQLKEGTASSQVITHYLKLGTMQAKLECLKLEHENKLLEAKTRAIESAEKSELMYKNAIDAFRQYSGME